MNQIAENGGRHRRKPKKRNFWEAFDLEEVIYDFENPPEKLKGGIKEKLTAKELKTLK